MTERLRGKMEILSKIEDVYLNILRVAVIALATLALIAVVVGLITATPYISTWLSGSVPAQVSGGTLSDFITEKRQEGVAVSPQDTTGELGQKSVPAAIKSAAASLNGYAKNRLQGSLDQASVEKALENRYEAIPATYQDQYAKSLDALLGQLQRSIGTPLTPDQIDQLLDWHDQRFQADIKTKEADIDAKKAASLGAITVAGSAFLAFMLIIFFFLVVKIERNLRLVHLAERTTQ